ncbi:type VI secretion system amidase effector protein Tae4 [Pedobacter sp.]|uniref:type VI secretion system amidase effector protein Tae4 n=1 Tax=Pedobacter sp. TaxID=1411316 RepID=UPI0031D26EB3
MGATTDSKAKIQSISYEKFASSVNAKQLGTLKQLVAPSSSNLNIQVAGSGTLSEVTISTDQVKRLEVSDTVSYVLSMELESSNSPTFRNLTIQQAKGKTTAFISTYTPTKEWILKRRATGHNPKFEGTVTYQMVPLSEQGNQVQAQMTCGYFVKFELVDMPCVGTGAQQHYNPEDCQYGSGEGGPWQDLVATVQWGCEGSSGGGPSGNPGDGGTGNTGGGGNTTPNYPEGYDPCASGEIKCNVPGPNQAQQLATLLGISEQSQIDFLDANPTAVAQLQNYLNSNGNSLHSKEFALWSISYLTTNTNENIEVFANNFLGVAEGKDGEIDDLGYYTNSIIQQQQMPSLQTYYANYPKKVVEGVIRGLTAGEVYTMVGGTLNTKNKNHNPDYQNACAIRGSRALNYSGLEIPELVYDNRKKTEKGADGKNYILSAEAFNRYMKDTFGPPTYALTSQEIGGDRKKIVDFLKGKTGIYTTVNKSPGIAGFSGHIDFIINGNCVNGSNAYPGGGVEKIEIWVLN